jgi:hypothetical protein
MRFRQERHERPLPSESSRVLAAEGFPDNTKRLVTRQQNRPPCKAAKSVKPCLPKTSRAFQA